MALRVKTPAQTMGCIMGRHLVELIHAWDL